MNICLCGSIAFYEQMVRLKAELERLGHVVKLPPSEVPNENGERISVAEYYRLRKSAADDEQWIWDLKQRAMKDHFEKVAWSDAVLLVNEEKNGIPGYIGANTFLEAGLALHLEKAIYLLHEIPEQPIREELLGMKPILLRGDISNISLWST